MRILNLCKQVFIFSFVLCLPLWASHKVEKTGYLYKGQVNAKRVNVRMGPSTAEPHYGILNHGESVEILKEEGDWVQIVLPSRFPLWINKRVVKNLGQNKLQVSSSRSKVNIRISPSFHGRVVDTIDVGTELTSVKDSFDWWAIRPPARYSAWVSKKFITKGLPFVDAEQKEKKALIQNKKDELLNLLPQVMISLDDSSVIALLLYFFSEYVKTDKLEKQTFWSHHFVTLYEQYALKKWKELSLETASTLYKGEFSKASIQKIIQYRKQFPYGVPYQMASQALYLMRSTKSQHPLEQESTSPEDNHDHHMENEHGAPLPHLVAHVKEIFSSKKEEKEPEPDAEEILKGLPKYMGVVYHNEDDSQPHRYILSRVGRLVCYLQSDTIDLEEHVFSRVYVIGEVNEDEKVMTVRHLKDLSRGVVE